MRLPVSSVIVIFFSVLTGAEELRRNKRAASAYTAAEKEIWVNEHIKFRKEAEAMDMVKMEWHEKLAESAQGSADKCVYKHDYVAVTGLEYTEETYGQNMFYHSETHDIPKVVASWHNEISYYTYNETKCQDGKQCGHYTQVVWYNTSHVGCGFKQCAELTVPSKKISNTYFVVCNYGPGGNVANKKPFIKGKSCARCDSGAGWCSPDGFCDNTCMAASNKCVCKMICARGFPTDPATCKCKCGDGYKGKFCLEECKDTATCPADEDACKEELSGPEAKKTQQNCPALCGKCVKLTDANKKEDNTDLTAPPQNKTTTLTTTTKPDLSNTTTATTATTAKTPTDVTITVVKDVTTPTTKPVATVTEKPTQGPKPAEDSEEELTIGVVMNMQADIKSWDNIWSNLRKLIAVALNYYCNGDPTACCGGTKKAPTTNLVYMSHADVQHGQRYPIEKNNGIEILIYAKSDNSTGCNTNKSRRRKRSTGDSKSVAIPKEVLLNAVEKQMDTINKEMKSCCNAAVTEVKVAPAPRRGLEGWEIALIVIAVLTALVVIAILLALADKRMAEKRVERQKLRERSLESKTEGTDNPQMKDDSAM